MTKVTSEEIDEMLEHMLTDDPNIREIPMDSLEKVIQDVNVLLADFVANPGLLQVEAGSKRDWEMVESWQYRGFDCEIHKLHMPHIWPERLDGHYCGYAAPINRSVPELNESERNVVQVHGGITFFNHGVYGFDCAHYDDLRADSPTRRIEWVKAETDNMVDSIIELLGTLYDYVEGELANDNTSLLLRLNEQNGEEVDGYQREGGRE